MALVQDVLDSMMMNIGIDVKCTLLAQNLQVSSDFSSSQLADGAHALLHWAQAVQRPPPQASPSLGLAESRALTAPVTQAAVSLQTHFASCHQA